MFASFVVDNGLLQLVNGPTRNGPTRASNVLDLLFVNDALSVYNWSVVSPFSIFDHNAVMWHSWFLSTEHAYNNNALQYDNSCVDYNALSQYLNGTNWQNLLIFVPRRCNESKELLMRLSYYIQRAVKHKQHLCRI